MQIKHKKMEQTRKKTKILKKVDFKGTLESLSVNDMVTFKVTAVEASRLAMVRCRLQKETGKYFKTSTNKNTKLITRIY